MQKRTFPDQAIICTHLDGENHSGNIHVHIVINSLRKNDVEHQDYMERNCDSRAGYKHHVTKPYLRYLKQDLMDTCIDLGLHQIDLLSPAKERVTDKEQWAKARGQENLDKENQKIIENGGTPQKTKFQTQKDELRDAIRKAAETARNEKEFEEILKEKYGITLKVSRGRYSYLYPDRTKPITGRMLGEDYREGHLREVFAANMSRHSELEQRQKKAKNTQKAITHRDNSVILGEAQNKESKESADRPTSLLRRLRINQQIIAEQEASRPSRRTRITALQKSAQAVAYLQENGYHSLDELNETYARAKQRTSASKKQLDAANAAVTRLNEQLHYTGRYYTHKKTYQEFLHAKNKGRFRSEHIISISEYESARTWLQSHAKDGTLPSYEYLDTPKGKFPGTAKVKEARDAQIEKKKEYRAKYNAAREEERELRDIRDRVNAFINAPALDEHTKARRQPDQSL